MIFPAHTNYAVEEPRRELIRHYNPVARKRKRRRWQVVLFVLLMLALLGGIGRVVLPSIIRNYVNDVLDRSPLYDGTVGQIGVHLWRGAYSIEEIRINKTIGDVPVPFFAARRIDFSVQWSALLHGRLVGETMIDQPELNFVDAPVKESTQTGAGGPWLQMMADLFPFEINRAVIRNGSIHVRVFQGK
jgi:hypothetical protein